MVGGYEERAPHPRLAQFVVCTWRNPAGSNRSAVLPDACIDLVWDGTSVVVAGPDTHAVPIDNPDVNFVGLRFRPGAAPSFLRVPASELIDVRVSLRELWGGAADELASHLSEAADSAHHVFEGALLRRRAEMPDHLVADPLVHGVVARLSRAPHTRSVPVLAGELGVSERTLRRRCRDALGYGPKTLERILRFRRALRLLRGQHPLADVAFEAGYADQAHLTNECRRLADATPTALASAGQTSLSANGYD